jgi:hypothetical protein
MVVPPLRVPTVEILEMLRLTQVKAQEIRGMLHSLDVWTMDLTSYTVAFLD